MSLILIVEDVAGMREQYAYDLARLGGHETRAASGVAAALELVEAEAFDCVLLDLEMPGRDGFDFLAAIGKKEIRVPVVVYTGTGNYDRCVRAVKMGASGFVDKAEPMEKVVAEIASAIERARLAGEVQDLRRRLDDDSPMIGESCAMKTLRDAIARVAAIPSPVLIQGESGTGKELVARELHRLGANPAGPFRAVNCAALPEALVESELFGHERGAFTGADRARKGAFESADGGSLFLDEVGELPPAAQAKLLRVLEEEVVVRVGGDREIPVRAKIVAATNRRLDDEVETGRFRQDLLFRLNVHVLQVPALAERSSDVPALVEHFLEATARRFGNRAKRIAAGAMDALARRDWSRNNVRELRNVVERLVIAADGDEIGIGDVQKLGGATTSPPGGSLKEQKASAERRIVLEALERNGWHVTNTAAELGLADHASLSKIMKRHGLKKG